MQHPHLKGPGTNLRPGAQALSISGEKRQIKELLACTASQAWLVASNFENEGGDQSEKAPPFPAGLNFVIDSTK